MTEVVGNLLVMEAYLDFVSLLRLKAGSLGKQSGRDGLWTQIKAMVSTVKNEFNASKNTFEICHICRFCISQHPEVESKVLAELDGLNLLVKKENPSPREMTFDDLQRLKYTSSAIKVRSFELDAFECEVLCSIT